MGKKEDAAAARADAAEDRKAEEAEEAREDERLASEVQPEEAVAVEAEAPVPAGAVCPVCGLPLERPTWESWYESPKVLAASCPCGWTGSAEFKG
jgi:hypothetical protein